ncbi:hypothetical protein ACI2JM_14425 [Psychrobacter sp. NPDC064578]|uniref:hypothetical protein n=1 Tax=Psychrobacter sp. NPDC064578 TaxID=3364493 RepID=UPI00384B4416
MDYIKEKNNMYLKRLKHYLLTQLNGKWYYQYELYTGIVFFDKPNNQLEAYEVKEGEIDLPYISPCQIGLPSPINIDSTGFCNEDLDEYGCGTIPQIYQDKLYQGMSYTFDEGICDREIYTIENGETENQIMWKTQTYEPFMFELRYEDKQSGFDYSNTSKDYVTFGYGKTCKETNQLEEISIKYIWKENTIGSLTIIGNILTSRNYLDCPIPLPKMYELIENYRYFIFDKFVSLHINEDMIDKLFCIWVANNSFKNVEKIHISGLDGLNDLDIFSNKQIFGSLRKILLNKKTSLKQVERLKAIAPDIDVIY